jgi:hypothetical protein
MVIYIYFYEKKLVGLAVEKDYYIATHDVPRMTFMQHEKRACMISYPLL